MPPADRTAWARLGRLLTERRTQISPRYANRRAFAADREMNWRTLHDVEQAKRDNFRPETMRAFETAYMLAPGSLDRALAGGDLEPAPPASPAPLRAVPSPAPGRSPALDVLLGLLDRHPDDEELAAEALSALVSLFPADDVIAMMAAREFESPAERVKSIRIWLTFLAEQEGRGEHGRSTGLPGDNTKETLRFRADCVRSWPNIGMQV